MYWCKSATMCLRLRCKFRCLLETFLNISDQLSVLCCRYFAIPVTIIVPSASKWLAFLSYIVTHIVTCIQRFMLPNLNITHHSVPKQEKDTTPGSHVHMEGFVLYLKIGSPEKYSQTCLTQVTKLEEHHVQDELRQIRVQIIYSPNVVPMSLMSGSV